MRDDLLLDRMLHFAESLADISRAMLRSSIGMRPQSEVKSDKTLVTTLDRAIEIRLRAEILAHFPDHAVWGEEFGQSNAGAEYQWILDPIDGTAPFIAGIPVYGTLVAVAKDTTPIIGLIDMPATQDRWLGAIGRQTLHNGLHCSARSCASLGDAMMTVSNPDFFDEDERPALEALKTGTHWRIYGGACMSYGLLASGRTDIAFDTKFHLHDFAGFRPIIEGAGGIITDWEGHPLTTRSGPRILAAGSNERHTEALRLVSDAFRAK